MKRWCGWLVPVVLLAAADPAWKDKKPSEWSDDEARQVLTDSPWAQTVTPQIERPSGGGRGGRSGIGIGLPGGIGMGGGGMGGGGMGGGGMGGRGGMGRGGGGMGMPGGQPRNDPSGGEGGDRRSSGPSTVVVRWESALPVQEANLKLKDSDAPGMDEGHYAIVVSGISNHLAGDTNAKPKAELKRKGQKTIKSTTARMIPRDKDSLVVFFFSRNQEISGKDETVDFEAQIGAMQVKATFDLHAMTYDGKLEL